MWSKLTCTVILFAELSYMQTYPTCRVILLARITVQIIILLISHVLAANQLPHHMISPLFCPGWKNRCILWNSNHQSSTFFFKAKIQGGHILLSKRFEGGEAHSLPPQTVHPINIVRLVQTLQVWKYNEPSYWFSLMSSHCSQILCSSKPYLCYINLIKSNPKQVHIKVILSQFTQWSNKQTPN